MSQLPIARAAAKVLSEEPLPTPPATPEERARMVSAIAAELAANARRRRRRRSLGVVAAAAALLLVMGGGAKLALRGQPARGAGITAEEVHGTVLVSTPDGDVPLLARASLADGERITTRDGEATITLEEGSRVRVGARSSAAVSHEPGASLVRVAEGTVTAMVAKLAPGQRFLVRTAEAEIEAHGTVFEVARKAAADCAGRTEVRVVEGRISIRDGSGERFLGPSEAWASRCAKGAEPEAPSAPPATSPKGPATTSPPTLAPSTPPSERAGTSPPSASAASPIHIPTTPSAPTPSSTAPTLAAPATSESPTPAPSIVPYPEFGRRK